MICVLNSIVKCAMEIYVESTMPKCLAYFISFRHFVFLIQLLHGSHTSDHLAFVFYVRISYFFV